MKKIIVYIIIFIFIATLLFFVYEAFLRRAGKDIRFTVSQGQGTRDIAQGLQDNKLIFSKLFFSLYVYQRHWYLQPGEYQIAKQMTMTDIARLFHNGDFQQFSITIPEGWRVTQIDDYLTEKTIVKKGEFTAVASSDEGYLFPDTYTLPLDVTPQEIRDMMIKNFNTRTAEQKVTKDTIILASIVEREAKFDEDRAKIAGVYLNRLEKGMKLEADPTIQYAKGSWDEIKLSDYQNEISVYNTYLHEGLPPTPICNPGLKSIEAVLYPEKNGWLYFFHKSNGHAVYSQTIEEHEANLKKYRDQK